MSVRETIKIMLFRENMTLIELAEKMTKISGLNYTAGGISQKLRKNTLRYDDFAFAMKAMGYKIKIIKEDEN